MKRQVIDQKGRLFGKLSVIDLAVILCVLIVAIGGYIKFMVLPQTAVTVEGAPVRYTIELVNVRDWAMHNIREGDAMFVSGVYVGTVVGVSYEPHDVIVQGNGIAWRGIVPERYVAFVEIEATATVSEGRFMVSRTVPMAVGNSAGEFTTRYAEVRAFVKEINLYGE